MKNIGDKKKQINSCTGCQVCAAVCPKDAISISLSEDGFYVPSVDEEKCINCSLCVRSCSKYDNNIHMTLDNSQMQVYAASSRDKDILKVSTSGGIATHLAEGCIELGYKVIGVVYDYDRDIAVNRIASVKEEISQFRGSKYIQSYTVESFKKILNDKSNQKYAVFGTPCQIYAINRYITLKKIKDKFLLIDLFCHGCPSINLWKKYSKDLKQKNGIDRFEEVEFRSKKRGWHEYCVYVKGKENSYLSENAQDPFYLMFFDDSVLCNACYKCQLRSTLEYTDIRLGDFWGSQYDTNIEGVSAVTTCTIEGKKLFGYISHEINIKKHKLQEVINAQAYGDIYKFNEEINQVGIELLKSNKDIDQIIKIYKNNYSKDKKIKYIIKKVIYKVPRDIRYKIKKVYHS